MLNFFDFSSSHAPSLQMAVWQIKTVDKKGVVTGTGYICIPCQ